MSDEIGRIKGLLEFERIEAVSYSMRELIEDLSPELVHRLPPKKPQADKMQAKAENTATILGEYSCSRKPRLRRRSKSVVGL
jgi:GR25 family glycosyltransferase involved in LPS biosynthesis